MTDAPKGQFPVIDDLEELLQAIEMVGVTVYEHSAKRVEDSSRAGDGEDRDMPEPEFQALVRGYEGGLEARFKTTYTDREFVLLVDLGVKYEKDEPFRLADSLVPRFLSDIAIMGAFPYIREALATSATRLGVNPPVLGLIRRGTLTFSRESKSETE